ncbi:MAG: hypothetical protein ACI4MP_03120 [Candidatus Ventricola sp.]
MNKRFLSMILCCAALFSFCAASQAETAGDYLTQIAGTYVELFQEMAREEYHDDWITAATPLVGEENAEAIVDMMIGMCSAEIYGDEAAALYAQNPESTRFNCSFLGGVEKFTVDGNTISGTDAQGNEVFSHAYIPMDVDNESDFIFYQSEDSDAGQFTYFAFSPDTMATTWHLEFRYSENLEDLYSWYEGNYAYWNAAGIAADYTDAQMRSAIELFATENLAEAE